MAKKYFLAVVICGLSSLLQAQTKLIAHKSHSGSNENFKIAYEEGLFDIENSNFGLSPSMFKIVKLDSIIFLSDSVAVIVKTESWRKGNPYNSDTTTVKKKDTLLNDFLFNKKNSVKYIKKHLVDYDNFENPADSVKFINQNKKKQSSTKHQTFLPGSIYNNDNNDPFGDNPVIWLSLLALFSIFAAGIYYLLTKMQKVY